LLEYQCADNKEKLLKTSDSFIPHTKRDYLVEPSWYFSAVIVVVIVEIEFDGARLVVFAPSVVVAVPAAAQRQGHFLVPLLGDLIDGDLEVVTRVQRARVEGLSQRLQQPQFQAVNETFQFQHSKHRLRLNMTNRLKSTG
jgi:hypothetical protein